MSLLPAEFDLDRADHANNMFVIIHDVCLDKLVKLVNCDKYNSNDNNDNNNSNKHNNYNNNNNINNNNNNINDNNGKNENLMYCLSRPTWRWARIIKDL